MNSPENRNGSANGTSVSRPLFALFLSGLFLVSFLAPIYFAMRLGNYLWREDGVESASKDLFPQAIAIQHQGTFLKVSHSSHLNPTQGEDFLLSAWFKLSRPLQDGERMVLVSKYDMETPTRAGYSLGLSRIGEDIRPIVYWRDAEGRGGWYTFAEMKLTQRNWFMLALSFRKNSLLGVHGAPAGEPLQLLGGYDMGEPTVPDSNSDLVLGAMNYSKFKGQLGPISIVSRANLSKGLEESLQSLLDSPQAIPEQLRPDGLKFWSLDGRNDAGPYSHTIELVQKARQHSRNMTAMTRGIQSHFSAERPEA